MKMAMDVIDVTARTYKMPTFRFARAVSLAKGTTAIMSTTGASMATGTIMKTMRSAPAGVRSSFRINFTTSAIGWSMPNGPQRLGPNRLWNRPMSLRSNQEKSPAPSSTPFTSSIMMARPAAK